MNKEYYDSLIEMDEFAENCSDLFSFNGLEFPCLEYDEEHDCYVSIDINGILDGRLCRTIMFLNHIDDNNFICEVSVGDFDEDEWNEKAYIGRLAYVDNCWSICS